MSMSQARLPSKKHVALALLEHSSVYIHLDPRNERVQVPPWFKRQAQLVLQVGLNMPIPIPDLNLDDQGVSCTLSFNRSPHHCKLPWASIFALVGDDGRGMVWPDDVPPEVAAQARQQQAEQQRSQLRAVDSKPSATEASPPAAESVVSDEVRPARVKRRRSRAAAERDKQPAAEAPAQAAPSPRRKRARKAASLPSKAADVPKLSVVGKAASARDAGSERAAGAAPGKKKRELPPYLRVVK